MGDIGQGSMAQGGGHYYFVLIIVVMWKHHKHKGSIPEC